MKSFLQQVLLAAEEDVYPASSHVDPVHAADSPAYKFKVSYVV